MPLTTGSSPNPGLALDFYRFASDSYVDLPAVADRHLRKIALSILITHNFMGFQFDQINYFNLAASLDFVSLDNYPAPSGTCVPKLDPSPRCPQPRHAG